MIPCCIKAPLQCHSLYPHTELPNVHLFSINQYWLLIIILIPCLLVLFSLDVLHTYSLVHGGLYAESSKLKFLKTGLKPTKRSDSETGYLTWSHSSLVLFFTAKFQCWLPACLKGETNLIMQKLHKWSLYPSQEYLETFWAAYIMCRTWSKI